MRAPVGWLLVGLMVAAPTVALAVEVEIKASSNLKGKADAYAPFRAFDKSQLTSWCEGDPGDGVGQSLTLTFLEPTQVDTIEIAAGYWKSAKLFKTNNRPVSLLVQVDGQDHKVSVPEAMQVARVEINARATSITIEIDGVKPGKLNDTCISEVDITSSQRPLNFAWGLTDETGPAFGDDVRALGEAFDKCDAAELQKAAKFPLKVVRFDHDKQKDVILSIKNGKQWAKLCTDGAVPLLAQQENVFERAQSDAPGKISLWMPGSMGDETAWTFQWMKGVWKLISIG